ncbi:hypothetical protein [Spirosoma aerolatum]|uniref:hypothetical protein n=1 Tax=Spirosoma aerolatum TaxID=1211326 RepID=UPI0009ADFF37|nr:hypothetical protein [Spirosoma aerolatum]
MVQVTKQAVQQWMMLEYLAKKHRYQSNINTFERKYTMLLEASEQHIETAHTEAINEWDDYIEWKADYDFLQIVKPKIQDIQKGNIEYIG